MFYICRDDLAEKVREGRVRKLRYTVFCKNLRKNILLGDGSLWFSSVFANLKSRGSECLCAQLCFQGYLYNIQPEKTEILFF